MPYEILSVAEVYAADRYAAQHGVPSLGLMENAGTRIVETIVGHYAPCPVTVLAGPGNNGGDGFVVARRLKSAGWPVRVGILGDSTAYKGDAAANLKRWDGESTVLSPAVLAGAGLVVDAVFGAGLSRPLAGAALETVAALNASGTPVVAVDVPSGLCGDTGAVLGEICVRAERTVTFFRKKPAHVLMPGRLFCGAVTLVDIGIPPEALADARLFENIPDLWRAVFPRPSPLGHKYDRGHAVAVGGPVYATGAGRLAARGALRSGAGLVSVACPPDAAMVNAAQLTAIMVKPFDSPLALAELLLDRRLNAVVIGPGAGVGGATRLLVKTVLACGAAVVLDADALSSFSGNPTDLFAQIGANVVLTPHAGEFERLFPKVLAASSNRIEAARRAAVQSGAVVLLKGPDTVVAAPDGRAAVATNAPATLASAGSGDVLAGIVVGLMAQRMPAFEAACAGVWLHGAAAADFGPGLIAEDIPERLPAVLSRLYGEK